MVVFVKFCRLLRLIHPMMIVPCGVHAGIAKDELKAERWLQRASELGHAEATYKLGREFLLKATVEPPPTPSTKGRKGRRKKQKKSSDGTSLANEDGAGVSFRTSDPNFVEGHALLKKAAMYGHEGATSIATQLDALVGSSSASDKDSSTTTGKAEL